MPNAMWTWLDEFPQQVRNALTLAQNWDLKLRLPLRSVTFLGIGGSAIGADLICALYRDRLLGPVSVVRGDEPPPWLDQQSLAVVISYSGDTRETLTALEFALSKRAQAVCIASGGALQHIATEKSLPCLQIPAGMAPRAALAFTCLPLIRVLQTAGFLSVPNEQDIVKADEAQALIRLLEGLRVEWGDPAGAGIGVARRMLRRLPLIMAAGSLAAAAKRFQAQLAENAKAVSVVLEIPEALHNLIEALDVSYIDTFRPIAVYLEDTEAPVRTKDQMRQVRQAFQQSGIEGIPILSQGKTPLARLFTIIHKTHWISYHLAMLKGVDPVAIPTILRIKQELSQE